MARNVEIKAKVTPGKLDSIRAAAESLATQAPFDLVQIDTFLKTKQGRLKIREFGDGTSELIFYHRPNREGPKTSEYSRSKCSPSIKDQLVAAFSVSGIVKKQRTVYLIEQTRLHLDHVENLGTFIELEVVLQDDQTDSHGESVANRLMQELGVEKSELVSGAYVDFINASERKTNLIPERTIP